MNSLTTYSIPSIDPSVYLFFAIPGFISFVIIRHVALFSHKQSQAEIILYSLVCSVPSYLMAITLTNELIMQFLLQTLFSVIIGFSLGYGIKNTYLKQVVKITPWQKMCLQNKGKYVIVYTKSGRRICGWMLFASRDSETRRDIVLGDPRNIDKKGKKSKILGKSMLITENETLRILYLQEDVKMDL